MKLTHILGRGLNREREKWKLPRASMRLRMQILVHQVRYNLSRWFFPYPIEANPGSQSVTIYGREFTLEFLEDLPELSEWAMRAWFDRAGFPQAAHWLEEHKEEIVAGRENRSLTDIITDAAEDLRRAARP